MICVAPSGYPALGAVHRGMPNEGWALFGPTGPCSARKMTTVGAAAVVLVSCWADDAAVAAVAVAADGGAVVVVAVVAAVAVAVAVVSPSLTTHRYIPAAAKRS